MARGVRLELRVGIEQGDGNGSASDQEQEQEWQQEEDKLLYEVKETIKRYCLLYNNKINNINKYFIKSLNAYANHINMYALCMYKYL